MCKPKESRSRLLKMIQSANRPIQLKEVLDFEKQEDLWFGPDVDAIDFLFAKQALGVISIDPRSNQIQFVH